jgi:hypothetical protein
VSNCRAIGKADMMHNAAMPEITVDPETYEVRADGDVLTCEPAQSLPPDSLEKTTKSHYFEEHHRRYQVKQRSSFSISM